MRGPHRAVQPDWSEDSEPDSACSDSDDSGDGKFLVILVTYCSIGANSRSVACRWAAHRCRADCSSWRCSSVLSR